LYRTLLDVLLPSRLYAHPSPTHPIPHKSVRLLIAHIYEAHRTDLTAYTGSDCNPA